MSQARVDRRVARGAAGGRARQVLELAGLSAVLAIFLFALPAGARAAECTNTWTGAAEGTWQTAGNWSAGHAPTSSEVACIPSGKTVNVTAGTNQAAVVQGEGSLKIKEATLELLSASEPSSIKNLTVQYKAILTGPATLNVSNSLAWTHESTMSGTGATVLGPSGTGSITTGGGWAYLKERRLVTEGAFAVNEGIMALSEGAIFENKGTLTVNHEAGVWDILDNGGTNRPKLVNAGVLRKTAGTGETKFDVAVENLGEIDAQTGTLGFTLKGAANVLATGSTLKGKINILGPSFTAGSFNSHEATIKIREASISVGSGSTATIGTLTMDYNSVLTGLGTFEISKGLTWSSDSKMSGSGSTVLKPSATAVVTTYWGRLAKRTFVNEGTFTLEGEGSVRASEGAIFKNEATLNANAVVSYARFPGFLTETGAPAPVLVNNGTIQKTVGTSDTRMNLNVENNGTIDVKTGRLLFNQSGAIATLSPGSEIRGNTRFELTGVSGTDFTVPNGVLEARESAVKFEGEDTSVANFKMEYATVVSGSGDVAITQSFDWHGQSTLGGAGTMTLEPGTNNVLDSGATVATLSQRTLVNQGTFTQTSSSKLNLAAGAAFTNKGTYNLNSEPYPTWVKDSIRFEAGPAPNRFINEGVFQRTEGTLTLEVTPEFENRGVIKPVSGKIEIKNPITVLKTEQFGKRCYCGDPIEAAVGNLYEQQTDISIGGRGVGLDLTRTYSAQAAAAATSAGPFGYGWTGPMSDRLSITEAGAKVTYVDAGGSTTPFVSSGSESYSGPAWSQDVLTGSPSGSYTLVRADRSELHFSGSGRLESVTDRNGNETGISYDEAGRLSAIEDPAGRQLVFAYNLGGQVESVEDPMGYLVKYTYESGHLASVTLPGAVSPRWQFKYDAKHRLTTITDGRGGKTTNEYDTSNRVISQTDAASRTLKFEYSAFHTKITNQSTGSVTDQWFNSNNQPYSITRGFGTASARTETFTYDSSGRLLSATDPAGNKTTYTYNASGDRTSVTGPDKAKTEWTYNGNHEVISMTTPGGQVTTIDRDENGNPEEVSQPAPDEEVQAVRYEYDAYGLLEEVVDPLERVWTFEHDAVGNLVAAANPEGDTRTWAYDENSRVTAFISPRGNEEGAEAAEFTTTIEPDPLGRPAKVVDPLGGVAEFAYDGNGNLSEATNANEFTTTYFYNGADELIKTELPNGDTQETGYNGAGLVTSTTDGNKNTTTYIRNVLGQMVEEIDPLARKTTYGYDLAGNVETVAGPGERSVGYDYDAAHRLIAIDYSDPETADVAIEYDADGNVTTMTDGSGETVYTYDVLGRPTEVVDGNGDSVAYEFDLANQRVSITYPNEESVSRTFDAAGRLASVTDWLEGTTEFGYDAESHLVSVDFPGSGNVDEFSFDRAGWLEAVSMKSGGEAFASLAYSRDPGHQIEAATATGLPGPAEEEFGYDENGRLAESGAGKYEYDPAGNLVKTPTATNVFDKAGQLETGGGVAYSYDALGERTEANPAEGASTTYAYDEAETLRSVARPAEGEAPAIDEEFSYDAMRLLQGRTVGESTQQLTWDTSRSLPLLLSDGDSSYVYGPGGMPIAEIDAEGVPTYHHHDQLASTRALTDETGEVVGSFTYEPYGSLAASSGSAGSSLGFAGQYTASESDLQYLRARYYDPATAQFLSEDPLAALTREPYGYAGGNPLGAADPSGLGPCIGGFIACDESDDPCDSPFTTGPFMALCAVPESAQETVVNASAGAGDSLLSPIPFVELPVSGPNARDWFGIDNVDECSPLYRFSTTAGDILTLRKGILKALDEGPGIWRDMSRRQNERFVHLPPDIIP